MLTMAISPFSARPASPGGERRRARLAVVIATLGIAATLLAYAISPGVRHAVSHAAHSVKHAVGHVFDHDHAASPPKHRLHLVQPLRPAHGKQPLHGKADRAAAAHKQAAPQGVAAPSG
jgi:hypothetical protein